MTVRTCLPALATILVAIALAIGQPARAVADIYQWAPSGSSLGGDGTWGAGQWYDGTGYVNWTDGNEANFTDVAGTVLNTNDRTVSGLVFTIGGYAIGASGTAGTITTGGASAISVTASTGATVINNALSLSSAGTVNNASSGSLTISGIISGANGLTKAGTGTVILNALNTYTGDTNVNAGILALNQRGSGTDVPGSISANSAVFINNGGTIRLDTNNGLGAMAGFPSVTINAGGLLTMSNGLTAHAGTLTLQGGTVSSIGTPHTTWGGWTLDGDILAKGSSTSTISATDIQLAKTSGSVTFNVDQNATLDVTGTITGKKTTAALVKSGLGTMILSNINTYATSTHVNAGTLSLAKRNSGTGAGTLLKGTNVYVNNGGSLLLGDNNALGVYTSTVDTIVSSVSIAPGGSMLIGSGLTGHVGTLNLQGGTVSNIGTPSSYGSWSFRKNVNVSGGTSTISASNMTLAAPSGSVTFNVADGSMLKVTGNFYNRADSVAALVKDGTGVMDLSGSNTYTGATIVNAGTLTLGYRAASVGTLGPSTAVTINNGGTVQLTATNALGYDANLVSSVTVAGGGLLTMADGLTGHLGGLTLQGGTLSYMGATPNPTWGSWCLDKDIIANGGVVSTINATAMTLKKAGGVKFTVEEDAALDVTGTITNIQSGGTGLIKDGMGTMILSGNNTYATTTTVNAGTLLVNNTTGSAAGTGELTVVGGVLGGTGSVAGKVAVRNGATLMAGTLDTVGILTLGGGLDLADGAKLAFDLAATNASDKISTTTLTFAGLDFADFSFATFAGFGAGSYKLIDAESSSGTFDSDAGTINGWNGKLAISDNDLVLTVTVIPEPNTILMLIAGLIGMIAYAWRKRN